MKMHIMRSVAFYSVATLSFSVFASGSANAQMNEDPWTFTNQNRASIASLIKSVEDADSSNASEIVSTGTTVTQLVCGGDSANASGAGNSTCIILNNSEGFIDLYQDNLGDISANSESDGDDVVDEEIDVTEESGSVDDVEDILEGNS